MKIAVTSQGDNPDSLVDERFGRAKMFIIYDEVKNNYNHIDNKQNLQAAQGAGIQASKTIIDAGAEVLITGNVGPKAYSVLSNADVKIYIGATGYVKDAINDYLNGKLQKAEGANVKGHW